MDVTLFMIFLLQGLWENEAFVVSEKEGETANIICRHSDAVDNVKYFCKDPCANNDTLITSTQKETGRYTIEDKGNDFFVTISDLTMADQGTYWCGVDRAGVDTYNEVFLHVSKKPSNNEDNKASNTNGSCYEKVVYIRAGLGTVVLALAVVLLIFMRHRKKDIHKSKRTEPMRI